MASNLVHLLLEKSRARPGLVIGTVDDQLPLADALAIAAGHVPEVLREVAVRRVDDPSGPLASGLAGGPLGVLPTDVVDAVDG